jgi:release factor glutamine methyltransferase
MSPRALAVASPGAARDRDTRALLGDGIRRLRAAGVAAAPRDAEWLLAGLCGIDRLRLYADPPRLDAADEARYRAAIERRARGEPIQYVLGWEEFCGLRFRVIPAVLIPRPETEGLVEWVLAEARQEAVIADVGTGSGCLALTLAVRRPGARLYAIDRSPAALAVAADNARRLAVAGRVRLVAGDLLDAFDARAAFDVIVANPPYIPSATLATLPLEVRAWEPRQALDGGPDGMDVHRRLVAQAAGALRPGGLLAMEVGDGQARAVGARMAAAGFAGVVSRTDLNGVERYVAGRRPAAPGGGRS